MALFIGWTTVISFSLLLLYVKLTLGAEGDLTVPTTANNVILVVDLANSSILHDANSTESVLLLSNVTESTSVLPPVAALPPKGTAEQEHRSSMAIFFILLIIVLSILLIHLLIVAKCHYLPESLAIVFLGALIGVVLKWTGKDWTNEEAFSPNAFFLIMLPPIIFESGYSLHKGNFFANIGSILAFAIIGTAISAFVIGGGIYVLGQADLIYRLDPILSMAFGSLISAVDPVATLAIFQGLDVDPVLYMLVFGESVLNDAVAIVLTSSVMEMRHSTLNGWILIGHAVLRFFGMFFLSALLGLASAIVASLLLKFIDLRKTPSLEFALMLVFAYLPYGLAEGLHLSGIMAILFCGIAMSHYTHFSLSAMTQATMQLTARTLAFVAETCVFAYLGMAFFTFPLTFRPVFVVWAVVLMLVSRALNIFPLSYLLNHFRQHKITKKMQFIMWFSGLRGAIAFALSLHIKVSDPVTRQLIITSTLCMVLFTTVFLGGSTMPLMKFLSSKQAQKLVQSFEEANGDLKGDNNGKKKIKGGHHRRDHHHRPLRQRTTSSSVVPTLIKAQIGDVVAGTTDSDDASGGELSGGDMTCLIMNGSVSSETTLLGFARFDAKYLRPLLTRKFTTSERRETAKKFANLAMQWYEPVATQNDDAAIEEEDGSDHEKTGNNVDLSPYRKLSKNGDVGDVDETQLDNTNLLLELSEKKAQF